jgi:DNA-binding transcriptional regulator/RsmH inhibitor MraZ
MNLSTMAQCFSYDSQGRISLDERLLKYAEIEGKEVVLLGNFSTFSIWSKEKYDATMSSDVVDQSAKIKSSLPKLGGI